MSVLDDLKASVALITADATRSHDEVVAALDHIMKEVPLDSNPDLKAAVDSLKASHSVFTDSLKTLQDKIDTVTASGGPA